MPINSEGRDTRMTTADKAAGAIREALAGVTPGEWMLATSNSWRRFVSMDGAHVCEPVVQRDGHPDLCFSNGGQDGPDARYIAAASPAALVAILDERDQLRKDAQRYQHLRARVEGHRDYRGVESFALSLPTPCVATIFRGSVAQHFDCAIDAERATIKENRA